MKKYIMTAKVTVTTKFDVWANDEQSARKKADDELSLSPMDLESFDFELDSHSIPGVEQVLSLSEDAQSFMQELCERHGQEVSEKDSYRIVDELGAAGLLHTPEGGVTRLSTTGIFICEDLQTKKEKE